MTSNEFTQALLYCSERGLTLPDRDDLLHGGIIGSVVLADSRDTSTSPWHMGEKAFLLVDPKPLLFVPMKGRLNFFEVPDDLVTP
ncbi:hypothetical protein [Pseudomonas sp. FW300-N1A1]|uniref:hypothetical protein n=1 Tax=Pseudomonas sp. FW300-N1A1 TaxID=2075555 RepID=UPI002114ECE7|nr:hypothetical protein [Pseudomonas sp. FW300-N1A1]